MGGLAALKRPSIFLMQTATFLLSDEINGIFRYGRYDARSATYFFAVIDQRDDDWHSDYLREAQASEKTPSCWVFFSAFGFLPGVLSHAGSFLVWPLRAI